MSIQIRHRDTEELLHTVEGPTLRHANLSGAKLSHAYLNNRNMAHANLTHADLSHVAMFNTDMAYAKLNYANLKEADLISADLCYADLSYADLTGVDLRSSTLTGANLTGTIGLPEAPVIEDLDAKILHAVTAVDCCTGALGHLDMEYWHGCETTHCRAGWAIVMAGEEGKKLEKELGSGIAGALIYHASTGRIPDFFENNEKAMADLRKCAQAKELHV